MTAASTTTAQSTMPRRRLGRTNEQVSLIGMGGFHIGHPHLPDDDMIKLIHAGIDRGITFLDNSWDYNAGMSELRMGRALSLNGYRDRVFLMTKLDGRTKASFNAQLEESLARLLTDRIDLVQFHENIRPDDADRIFAPGGAFEAAIAAKAAGKLR
jgi:aryl-alcohol dehydrogenase-like predicted oxidoreductase